MDRRRGGVNEYGPIHDPARTAELDSVGSPEIKQVPAHPGRRGPHALGRRSHRLKWLIQAQ